MTIGATLRHHHRVVASPIVVLGHAVDFTRPDGCRRRLHVARMRDIGAVAILVALTLSLASTAPALAHMPCPQNS